MARRTTELSDNVTHAVLLRKTAYKNKNIKRIREITMAENAKQEPKLASKTLSICRQENRYFVDYVDLWLRPTERALNIQQSLNLHYQEYVESIKALYNNINFILSAQNFGQSDKNGKQIDLAYMKNLNFDYSVAVRSVRGCRRNSHSITNENELTRIMINVLTESEKIIDKLETELAIDELNKHIPNFTEKFEQLQDFKTKMINIANSLLVALENNKVNLKAFQSEICFETKYTALNSL
jgi:hypothetical protein